MIPENFSKQAEEETFNDALSLAISVGSPCVMGAGLSSSVMRQINTVARAYPKAPKSEIDKAKELFFSQQES